MNDVEKPFKVLADTGRTHSAHMTATSADAKCAEANRSAEALGITTRYIVKGL